MEIERCNEINLIQQTLAGKTSAFDQLVRMYRSTIYVLVLSYIKNPADAEDLTQRIFIRAYERLATLRELDCFLAWLQQIAHNTCKDWLRRRSELATSIDAVKDADFSETAPSAEDIVLKAEVENIVRKAIDGLKETDRKLMEAHYIEGASYDELRAGSGLSYAAIANRLKRAKREVRRRVRKLLGGVAILPGRTFILGGIETVKLSAKVKLATAALATVIGVGGGGALYHHTAQLEPIVANNQKAPEERIAVVDSSTGISSTTYAGAAGSSSTNETSVFQRSQVDRFKIMTDDGAKIVEEREMSELPEEFEEFIHTLAENHSNVDVDDAALDTWTINIRTDTGELTEVMLVSLPEEIRGALKYVKTSGANPKQEVRIDSGQELPEDVREAIEKLLKQSPEVEIRASEIVVPTDAEDLTQYITKKITSGEFPVNIVIERPQSSTSTDSEPLPTDSFPQVESTPIPSGPSKGTTPLSNKEWAEFERLLSASGEFSDEEWTELERMLDITSGRTTPQQDRRTPLNAARQQNMERIPEEPPVIPSMEQERWRQQPDLPESNSDVSPYPTTEDWQRTME